MVFSMAACTSSNEPAAEPTPSEGEGETAAEFSVAMITDYGDITDESFNQATYEACKAFSDANGIKFNYYKPAGDSTAERVAMIDAAIADGFNVIVCPGFAFGEALAECSTTYPLWTFPNSTSVWIRFPTTCSPRSTRKSCAVSWPVTQQ